MNTSDTASRANAQGPMRGGPRRVARSRVRYTIFAGLLLAQIATVIALGLVSGRLTGRAESEHTNALLETTAAESVDRVRAHIAPAESIVALTSTLAADPTVSFEAFVETFRHALERSPQLDGIFLATPDGDFTYVSRTEDGYRVKTIDTTGARQTNLTFLADDGSVIERSSDPADTYDPTVRPWYQDASLETDRVIWTDPYVFFTSQQLGITAARSIWSDGELVGVVGADIELGSLSSFLSTLRVGERGGTIIVNQSGTVIAHPDPSIIQSADGDGFRTVGISELTDRDARAAVASYVEAGLAMGEQTVTGFDSATFGPSRAAFRSVPVGDGEWSVGIFGPGDDLVRELAAARGNERRLIIVVGALSILLVGLLALPGTRPIGHLETEASTDALTQIPNRRSILETATVVAGLSRPRAAAMIDVDHFKHINDTGGHQVGDQVLQALAQRISATLRPGDVVGRVGGEEFLVLFPDASAAHVVSACERIRLAISATAIATTSGPVEVTVSIGVATASTPVTLDRLMSSADVALFQAKLNGRDQVVAAYEEDVLSDSVSGDASVRSNV